MTDSKDTLTEPVRENPAATYRAFRWDEASLHDTLRSRDCKSAESRKAALKRTLLYLSAIASP